MQKDQLLYQPFAIRVEKLDISSRREEQHHYFEMIYIFSGRGKLWLEQNVINYRRGCLFLITPNTPHYFENYTDSDLFLLDFNKMYIDQDVFHLENIDRLRLILTNANRRVGPILTSESDKKLVRATVDSLRIEILKQNMFNTVLVQQLVKTLIIMVARNIEADLSEQVNENTDGRIMEILNYIQSNICCPDKLRTSEISRRFNISTNYLGRYFKKHCNETLRDYINNSKRSLIEQRLRHSDKRINEIVSEFGFTDESHLNKFFKQHCGTTPSTYRHTGEKK